LRVVTTEIAIAQVVGEYVDDIRLLRGEQRIGTANEAEDQAGKLFHSEA
jgi:hypothetical protein